MCGLPENAESLLYLVVKPNIKAAVLTFARLRVWLNFSLRDLRLPRHKKNCFVKNSLLTSPAIHGGSIIAGSFRKRSKSQINASVCPSHNFHTCSETHDGPITA